MAAFASWNSRSAAGKDHQRTAAQQARTGWPAADGLGDAVVDCAMRPVGIDLLLADAAQREQGRQDERRGNEENGLVGEKVSARPHRDRCEPGAERGEPRVASEPLAERGVPDEARG